MTGLEKLNLMRKKCSFFIGFLLLIGGVFSGFKKYEIILLDQYKIRPDRELTYDFPNQEEEPTEEVALAIIPFTGKTYVGFKQAVAARESNGLYKIINSYGYIGKYQFGKLALRSIGIFDTEEFLNDPLLQEKAFDALIAKNKWILRHEIEKFVGRRINGVRITESGILAAAHLGGAGSVRKFLKSNGANGFNDGYGTSIVSYMKKFSGFDVSEIEPEKNALAYL